VTPLEEGLLAMRGCWRLLWRDPAAFEDFNLTIEGFWRSFAVIVPVSVLAYPMFVSTHDRANEVAAAAGEGLHELRLGVSYLYLLASIVLWPLAAAVLARVTGVAQNYVRYVIIYNWMQVPMTALLLIPNLLFFVILANAALIFSVYVSWYVAKAGLQTTAPIAFVFLVADFALTYALGALIR
jgi:hypothetical protein